MATKADNYLILIQFLDLLCLGIIRPSLPPTIMKSGGSILHLGMMIACSAVIQVIAVKLCNEFEKIIGNRKLLKYSLLATTFLNASLLFTSTATGMVLNRIAFAFAYKIPFLCGKLENKDARKEGIYKNMKAQGLLTVIIGCATVGSFIDDQGGFSILLIISSVISIITIATAFQLEQEKQEKPPTTTEALTAFTNTFNNIKTSVSNVNIDFKNWNALVIKFLLMTHSFIVFTLFVILIGAKFQGNGRTICTVAAYQAIVLALIEHFFEKLNGFVRGRKTPKKIFEISAICCAFSAISMNFAPSIPFYCAIFIPLAIGRKFVDKYYVEVFQIEKNEKLSADLKTFGFITEIISPLIIGLLFSLLEFNAYRMLSVGPMFWVSLIMKKTVKESVNVADKENKKD